MRTGKPSLRRSPVRSSVKNLVDGVDDLPGLGKVGLLQLLRVRHRDVGGGDSEYGRVEVVEAVPLDAVRDLGPEARGYFRVLQDFTKDVPVTLRPVFNGFAAPGEFVRRYALSDGNMTLLYIHHYRDRQKPIRANVYVWTGPGNFDVTWIDPATGNTVAVEKVAANGQVCRLETPEVAIDIAAKIIRSD